MTESQTSKKPIIDIILDNSAWVALILVLIGLVILTGIFIEVLRSPDIQVIGGEELKLEKSSQFGDYIGGVVGSFWSLAGVILVYSAFRTQGKEFKAQQEELKLQREQLGLQLQELSNQRKELIVNRTTNILFKQIDIVDSKRELVETVYTGTGESALDDLVNLLELLEREIKGDEEFNNDIGRRVLTLSLGFWKPTHIAYLDVLRDTFQLCDLLLDPRVYDNGLEPIDTLQLLQMVYTNLRIPAVVRYLNRCKDLAQLLTLVSSLDFDRFELHDATRDALKRMRTTTISSKVDRVRKRAQTLVDLMRDVSNELKANQSE